MSRANPEAILLFGTNFLSNLSEKKTPAGTMRVFSKSMVYFPVRTRQNSFLLVLLHPGKIGNCFQQHQKESLERPCILFINPAMVEQDPNQWADSIRQWLFRGSLDKQNRGRLPVDLSRMVKAKKNLATGDLQEQNMFTEETLPLINLQGTSWIHMVWFAPIPLSVSSLTRNPFSPPAAKLLLQ